MIKTEVTVKNSLNKKERALWENLLCRSGLFIEDEPDSTVLVFEGDELVATGSRKKSLLKYIAVSENHQGEDLTATVITSLRKDAFEQRFDHLFLYTKPKNLLQFKSLFFYPVVCTSDVLLMESKKDGITDFLNRFNVESGKTVGAAVMNCNPFTKGHRYLIETAAKECDRVYVFVLSEEGSLFSAPDRLSLVKEGVKDLKNVTVLESGPYLISSSTFPSYFLKDRDSVSDVKCELDIKIFVEYYAKKFGITRRYVGQEPFSKLTEKYNECLKKSLPEYGIEVKIIPRLKCGETSISASEVRELIKVKNADKLKKIVPKSTFNFLEKNGYI